MNSGIGALRRGFVRRAPRQLPIAYKLALVFALLIASGMVLLGILVAREQGRLLEQQMRTFGLTVAKQMAESAKEPLLAGDNLTLEVITSNLATHERILGAAIYSEELKPVFRSGEVPLLTQVAKATDGSPLNWNDPKSAGNTYLVSFIAPVRVRDVVVGYTLVTFDRSLMLRAKRDTIQTVSGATLLLLVLGVGASILLGKRLTRPITQLMDAGHQISAGNYQQFCFDERRNDELGRLMESMNTMSEGLLRKEQVEQVFSRYVSPNVAMEVLDHLEQVQLGGHHVEASVLFADIVGFTAMTENMPPEQVNTLLNEYFTYVAQAAHAFGGHVDKYIGDCAMLVFGVPQPDPEHAFNAVACGVLIQQLVETLNRWRAERGLVEVRFRIGINGGTMLAGNMGSAERMNYTVVGDAVNLASRLGSTAEPGEIIISEEMHSREEVQQRVVSEHRSSIQLRGKRKPVATYRIGALNREHSGLLEQKFAAIMDLELAT